MSAGEEPGSGAVKAVTIGVAIALLTAGSAPWWWEQLTGGHGSSGEVRAAETTESQPAPDKPKGGSASTPGTAPEGSRNGCTIATSAVATLRRSTDPVETGTRIPAGMYAVIHTRTTRWVSSDIQWFQISVDGRIGWVEDNPAEIESRSAACP
jgi:hypothetical protein